MAWHPDLSRPAAARAAPRCRRRMAVGAVPRTSTYALNNVTLPHALAIAHKGYRQALLDNPNFLQGLNVCMGKVTHAAVARDLGYDYVAPATALAA